MDPDQPQKQGDFMTSPMMQHIPLASAYLCQDCECIGNCATTCPACASRALLALACVLNRDEAMSDTVAGLLAQGQAVTEIGSRRALAA